MPHRRDRLRLGQEADQLLRPDGRPVAWESTVARPLTRKQRVWRRIRRRWKTVATALCLALGAGGTSFGIAWMDPQRQVDRAMHSGDCVELIGPTGPPKWSRIACGGGRWETDQHDRPFEISTTEDVVLELAPSTYSGHYRIRAEMKICESFQTDSWAGVYCAHNRGAPAPEGVIERLLLAYYRRDLFTPVAARKGPQDDRVGVYDSVICPVDGSPDFRVVSTLGVHRFPAGDGEMREPWRYIEIEVDPDAVRVRWRDPDGSLKPVGYEPKKGVLRDYRTLSQFQNNIVHLENFLTANKITPTAVRRLDFRPQGAMGLYVLNARAAFRNVVFEPITPGSTP